MYRLIIICFKCIYLCIMMIITVYAYRKLKGTLLSMETALCTFFFLDVGDLWSWIDIDDSHYGVWLDRQVHHDALLSDSLLQLRNIFPLQLHLVSKFLCLSKPQKRTKAFLIWRCSPGALHVCNRLRSSFLLRFWHYLRRQQSLS